MPPSLVGRAGVDDFEVAEATYRAAVARWPAARITLRRCGLMSWRRNRQLILSYGRPDWVRET
jgi:hypothetical protein